MCQTDADCVRLCLDGHPEMFRHLVRRYQGPLVNYLAGRLGDKNEVAEAAQETMVRAYFALRKLKKAESFCSWLLGIADRVAKEAHRGRRHHTSSLDVETVSDNNEAAPDQGDRLDWELTRAVGELPDLLRQVVLMRFYGERTCDEISRDLGVPLGTITSRLSRAYALLRKALPKRDKDDVEVEA